MSNMTPEVATALRKPFPKESIGKLPKGGAMLDYVGHAAVTDRLLTVDPEWSWEPLALDEQGLPALDASRNLWIKLTICGVTRLGVGDGKSAKEAVGDAIRNAAMRFGVALDLWAKENLVEFAQQARAAQTGMGALQAAVTPPASQEELDALRKKLAGPVQEERADTQPAEPMKGRTRGQMFSLLTEQGITERADQIAGIVKIVGHPIESRSELTEAEGLQVIESLKARAAK